jgi:hypothetical protein
MPRYRSGPLTLDDIWRDGPAVRVRDLVHITGLHADTVRSDIASGDLVATKRRQTSPYLVPRDHARRWLTQLGFNTRRELSLSSTIGTPPNLTAAIYQDPHRFLQAVCDAMGLGSILRNGVATANRITGATDGLQGECKHYAWTGQDGYGKPTYASVKKFSAVVNRKQVPVRTATGEVLLSRAQLTILQPLTAQGADERTEPIDLRDKIRLPDSDLDCKILDVQGVIDPSTGLPFGHEVFLA